MASECACNFLTRVFLNILLPAHMQKCRVYPRAPLQFQICIKEKEIIPLSFYAIQQQKGKFYTDPDSED